MCYIAKSKKIKTEINERQEALRTLDRIADTIELTSVRHDIPVEMIEDLHILMNYRDKLINCVL